MIFALSRPTLPDVELNHTTTLTQKTMAGRTEEQTPMKRYSIYHVPVLSFFSRSLYRDVCFHWESAPFVYLLLLLAVCMIVPIVRIDRGISEFMDNEAPNIIAQIPAISISDGEVYIDEPQPYYIREPWFGGKLVVIDTTGDIASPDEAGVAVLITKTEAIIGGGDSEVRTYGFQSIDNFTLDRDDIASWLATIDKVAAPILYVVAVLVSFALGTILALIYAAIGLLFASWLESDTTYDELLRLAAIALTPPIIIMTLLSLVQIDVPLAGLWYLLMAMGYLFFGIRSVEMEEIATAQEG